MRKIGLIVNPVAGLGGMSAFRGSDDVQVQSAAMKAGYEKQAIRKAEAALEKIRDLSGAFQLFTVSGEMGENAALAAGIRAVVLRRNKRMTTNGDSAGKVATTAESRLDVSVTTAEDTHDGVRWLLDNGADVIVFAGGDGTARDVLKAAGEKVPVIGIPAGVKMHSAVYAVSAAAAGYVLRAFVQDKSWRIEKREVMDIDEALFRRSIVSASLFGFLPVVVGKNYIQNTKQSSVSTEQELETMTDGMIREVLEDVYYLIGPGSTTEVIKKKLTNNGSLLGVDVVKNRKMIIKDADERQLYQLLDRCEEDSGARILTTFIGGQGHVFGRGNQQFSPRVIRKVGKENILIVATVSKLAALRLAPLLVDTGDSGLDAQLSGYYKIMVNAKESVIYRVSCI